MATNRKKPILAATVTADMHRWVLEQSVKRGVPVSQVVSEAIALMRVGMVYQLDRHSLTIGQLPKTAA
jgi:hypothetical protein